MTRIQFDVGGLLRKNHTQNDNPYLSFVVHKMCELLDFRGRPAKGLQIYSITVLFQLVLDKKWRAKFNISELESILTFLKFEAKRYNWLVHYCPTEVRKLINALDSEIEHIRVINEYYPRQKYVNEEMIASSLSIVEEIANKTADLISGSSSPSKRAIKKQNNAIVEIIKDNEIEHFEKLYRLDNLCLDFTRDLIHFGHSPNFIYGRWLASVVLTENEEYARIIDRFSSMETLLEDERIWTVLINIRKGSHPESDPIHEIGSRDLSYIYGFPNEFDEFEGIEKVREWYTDRESSKEINLDKTSWIRQEIASIDPVDATIKAMRNLMLHIDVVDRLRDPQRKTSISTYGNPVVADLENRKIDFYQMQSGYSLEKFAASQRVYEVRDKWLEDNIQYNEETFDFILDILDWLTQAEHFNLKYRKSYLPGRSMFVSLWTTFHHLFSGVDWFKHLPPYIVITQFEQELQHIVRMITHYKDCNVLDEDSDVLEQLKDLRVKDKYGDMIDLCANLFHKETEYPLFKNAWIDFKMLKISSMSPDFTGNPTAGWRTTGPFEMLKSFEKEVKFNITMMNKIRNSIVHEKNVGHSSSELLIVMRIIGTYISRVLEYMVFRFRKLDHASVIDLHNDVNATYRTLKGFLRNKTLRTSRALLNPHILNRRSSQ